ncbi:hypothetical protein [Streptococcus canis]|uniref:Uncharacterized protein n=1 Tax=Streptococcus canis TaxID=1329 RepID=A0AAE4TQD6_STRCB|nr:hypothetical protein [Streptococcus canis]MDV5977925.1 hypothetical protein [Streptococcus canis]
MAWEKIYLNTQNIIYDNGKSCLIKLPNDSDYTNFKFWHPSKLIRDLSKGNGYFKSLSFTDDWEFKIFEDDKNYKKIKEEILSPEELVQQFETMSETIEYQADAKSFYEEYEPKKINKEVAVLNELTR